MAMELPESKQGKGSVPTKTQLSNSLGTPGEDYFKGHPKSLNSYFLVVWWGKGLFAQTATCELFAQNCNCRVHKAAMFHKPNIHQLFRTRSKPDMLEVSGPS